MSPPRASANPKPRWKLYAKFLGLILGAAGAGFASGIGGSKTDNAERDTRLERLESDTVPREVHEQHWKAVDQRLEQFQRNMDRQFDQVHGQFDQVHEDIRELNRNVLDQAKR